MLADVDRRQHALGRELADESLGQSEQLGGAGGVDGDPLSHRRV